MFLWNWDNTTETLHIDRVDKGKVYKVAKKCTTTADLVFWLKHYQNIDIETFKLCSVIDRSNSSS